MPVLLVINRDDGLLPPGWVSAVLPEGAVISDYEQSGELYQAVAVPDGPALAKRLNTGTPLLSASGRIFRDGAIIEAGPAREVVASRLAVLREKVRPLPGPEGLDRSHSTIWDYGPGRTYSTPQSAFDALLMQVGADPFTETHYVRGFGGTHGQGPSHYVLLVSTVSPSIRFPLVLDAAEGAATVFDGEGGDCCLAASAVNHVRVSGLGLNKAYLGIVLSDGLTPATDCIVEKCRFDGADGSMQVGVAAFMADHLRVLHCVFQDLYSHGIGGIPGYQDAAPIRVEVSGCLIQAGFQGIWDNLNASYILANNTIKAGNHGINHAGSNPLALAGMINNVFTAAGQNFTCITARNLATQDLTVARSDGNCFHPGASGAVANVPQGRLDLAGWQEWFGGDARSIAADPQLDDGLVPLPNSPCLGAGVCWDDTGASGKRRARTVDIGCEQLSGNSPSITVRRAPEIARKT